MKLSKQLSIVALFFLMFTNISFAQSTPATNVAVPLPSIKINEQLEYTIRTGERIPEFTWNANLPTGANASDYTFKTRSWLNSSSKCKGIVNKSKALAGNSVSGKYIPTEVAKKNREGCEITFRYEVVNKNNRQKYTAQAVLRYVGENSGTNRGQLLAGLIQGEAADAQKTKTNGTLFTGTDAYIAVDGLLPASQAAGTVYTVVIDDGSYGTSAKTVNATLIKNTNVVDGKTIHTFLLKFTTPGNLELKSGVKVYVQNGNTKSNIQSVRVTCGTVCPGGPVVNPTPTPTPTTNPAPTASILISGQATHTVRIGETHPTVTWSSTNGAKYRTYLTINDTSKCSGIKNNEVWGAGKTASGTYSYTTKAPANRVGCEVTYNYEVTSASGQKATARAVLKYATNTSNTLLNNPTNNSTPTLAPQTPVNATPRPTTPTTPVTNPTTTTDPVPTATNNLQPTLASASKTTVAPGERILLTGTNILTSGTNNIDFVRKSDGAKYTFTQSKKGGKTTAIFFPVPTTIQGQALTAGEYTITLKTIYGTSNSLTVTVTTTTAIETSSIIPVVSQGARGEGVMLVQYALQQAGFFTEEITGYFGNITKAAVQAFQNANTLENVGAVGPRTATLLNSLLD